MQPQQNIPPEAEKVPLQISENVDPDADSDDTRVERTRRQEVVHTARIRLAALLQQRLRQGHTEAKIAVLYPLPPEHPTREKSLEVAHEVIAAAEFRDYRAEVHIEAHHVGCQVVLALKDTN